VTVVQRGIRGFFSNVVGFVVRFVFTEKIAKWIAEQGGWVRSISPRSTALQATAEFEHCDVNVIRLSLRVTRQKYV